MNKLVEFKLHNGHIPYFVKDIISGVDINGKCYGISHDTKTCYLPDTVNTFTETVFIETVKSADIFTVDDDINGNTRLMTENEKEQYCIEWLNKWSDGL